MGNMLARILNHWRQLPSRWRGHATVAYELLLAFRRYTDLGGRKAAVTHRVVRLSFVPLCCRHPFCPQQKDIARLLPLRICIALYSFVCRRSALGLLSAVLIDPALAPNMELSLHRPRFLQCFAHDSRKCKTVRGDNT